MIRFFQGNTILTTCWSIAVLFIFPLNNTIAQSGRDDINFEKISIPEGLSSGTVTSIIQDKYGFLWIGTEDGLNRYDGYEFKIYKSVPGNPQSLIDNLIWEISEDSNGNLWIATDGGISFYNRLNNTFDNYDIEELIEDYSPSDPQTLSIFIDSKNNIWAGTYGAGILKYDQQNNEFVKITVDSKKKIDESVYHVVLPIQEINNRLFAGDIRYGLIEYNEEDSTFRAVEFKSDKKIPDFSSEEERITELYADQNNQLWIVTEYGTYKYNLQDVSVINIQQFKARDVFAFWRMLTGITQDHYGNVWLGKDARGLYKFDGISNDFKQVRFGPEYENKPNTFHRMTRAMFTDNTGIIWIGTMLDGIYKFDPASEPFIHHTQNSDDPNSISSNEAFGLTESKLFTNTVYVGTRGGGLNKYNPLNGKFSKIELKFESDIFGGSVRSIMENKDGSLYIGSWGDGLLNYSKETGTQLISKFDSTDNTSLPNDLVRVLEKDAKGNIWVGTNYGLAVYYPQKNHLKRFYTKRTVEYPQELITIIRNRQLEEHQLAAIQKVENNQNRKKTFSIDRPRKYLVVSVGESLNDSTTVDYGWIETEDGQKIWSADSSISNYYLNGAEKNRIVADIITLKPGRYHLRYKSNDSHSFDNWNATAPIDSNWWGIQILKITDHEQDQITDLLKQAEEQPLIHGMNIRSIVASKKNSNIIWIGTDAYGLDRYEINSRKVTNYAYDSKNPNSVSNNSIQYIHETKDGILWLATNYGLNRFDPLKEEFTTYTEENGLPTNYIASILEDDQGVLWLATRNGLSRMSLDNGRASFVNYDSKDGLGGTDFIAQVALKTADGRLFFGGDHGLNEFYPGRMNTTPPVLLFTDIKIGNKSVTTMENNSPISNSIFKTTEINLNHEQNNLTFEFAALHFSRAEKNQYGHYLEGYDEEWTYDNRRFATYTNLDPGEYVFHVRGSNSDGIWDEKGIALAITIDPAWYGTWWAYSIFALAFISILFGLRSIELKRREQKARITESELRVQAAEAQAKISQAENERKTKELEEARQLQLSMLPKELPQLPNLDIAVYMKTATEVGGDYYDFHVSMDGTLTVVAGDATGHGMKAGTMVTTAKSLFNSYAPNPDILFSFQEITRCIKQMNLGKMSMCMTMLKIEGNKLQLSSAGMPPSFIFRRDTRIVEEHLLQGMPLGTMDKFPYKILDTKLNPGDTILLLTDGLPELQNKKAEIYGYKRVRNVFEEVAEKEPEEIINYLKDEGSAWVDDKDPDDDVTFVVIKVK